jgi:hypothetical protein
MLATILKFAAFCAACIGLWLTMRGPTPPGGYWE